MEKLKTAGIYAGVIGLVYAPLIAALLYTNHPVWAGIVWLFMIGHFYAALVKGIEGKKTDAFIAKVVAIKDKDQSETISQDNAA